MSGHLLRVIFISVLLAFLLGVPTVQADDERDLVRRGRSVSPLDDEFTSLLYLKTTNYGATWGSLTYAHTLNTAWQLPDFSAVVMNNNELCYAIFLAQAPGDIPGVYALAGPSFTPVLAMPESSNDFGGVGSTGLGWSQIGKTPNGDLFILIWGANASGNTTFWGVKSPDNGATWEAPFVIAAYPTIPQSAGSPQLSDLNSAGYCYVLYQDEDTYDQYFLRFPAGGGAGTITDLNETAFNYVSYYTGNCKPIAYDPAENALFICFRNSDASGTRVGYSSSQGQSFSWFTIPGTQRYPSMALRNASQTPFVISNVGVPAVGQYHWAWYAYDEGGYGGGLWTDRDTMVVAVEPFDGIGPLYYMNQAYFWDDFHGVGSHPLWGMYTPEGLWTSRTTNGGVSWIDFGERWNYLSDSLDPATLSLNELVGGTDGVAYIVVGGRFLGVEPAHFHAVDSTEISYPVTVEHATWWDGELGQGDEIGVFDDTLCVGAGVYFGSWPVTVTCWQADTALNLPGFTPGDSMAFKLWYGSWHEESSAIPTYIIGDGTFGFGQETRVNLEIPPPPGDIFLPETSYNYGNVPVGAARSWTLRIQNQGQDVLTVFDISTNDSTFSLSPPFPGPIMIQPYNQYAHTVEFEPLDTLAHSGIIYISSDDPDEPIVTVTVQGHGVARPPSPFALLLPTDGDTVIGNSVFLDWQNSIDMDTIYSVHYDVWLDTLAAFSAPWLVRDSIGVSQTTLTNLLDNHTYCWTVRATDNNTPGMWAIDTFRFVYNPPNAAGEPSGLPTEFALAPNFPNPFNPSTTIRFAVPRAGRVMLTVFDLQGRQVESLSSEWREPGYYAVTLDGVRLTSGVYFVRMDAPQFSATRKIVLMK